MSDSFSASRCCPCCGACARWRGVERDVAMGARANIVLAVLIVGAIALGALGFAGFGEETANSLLFAAWSLTLLALFTLALRLPLRGRGSRLSAWITTILVTAAAIA